VTLLTLRRAAHASPVAVALLIVANLVPLVGVLFFGWSLTTIVALYWLENGVLGAFALARIATAEGVDEDPGSVSINGRQLSAACPGRWRGAVPRARPHGLVLAEATAG
jgi:hypothetical protein